MTLAVEIQLAYIIIIIDHMALVKWAITFKVPISVPCEDYKPGASPGAMSSTV